MTNQLFVLMYEDGTFVKRDDSTGPMSTGGYPYPVLEVEEATWFESIEAAAKYAQVGAWRDMMQFVYPLEVTIGEGVPFPAKWEKCNRCCVETPESTAPTAAHFLDCSLWESRLKTR